MPRRVSSDQFVDRTEEVGELLAALGRTGAGEAGAALVGGESGVGKSRLAAEVIARAREHGARVLLGDCVDLGETELPFAAIVGALRSLTRDVEPGDLDALLG